ncbi:hypothetical protein DPMN_112506 [Dreissena polymorpha]|uniref:Uncharacterized protein n=1 Tax=Dreissena polymorpha TaxID=45954 RepID=A0A9D4QPY7_DREPO|nr:hypothetical protein DPMN_112506 [Dreissena polymorpha]
MLVDQDFSAAAEVKVSTPLVRHIQKMPSDMNYVFERIAREMSRQNRLLDKQTDLRYKITKGILPIRDDLNQKKSRKENRPPIKSVAKS